MTGPRSRAPARQLLDEARGIEVLLAQAAPPPEETDRYWDLSIRLINLIADIEAFAAESPQADALDPQYLELRHALTRVEGEVLTFDVE